MTVSNDPLDRLAPALSWEPDWSDVLQRAEESMPRRGRALVTKRRLLAALALLGAVLLPLAALGAATDWWFLSSAGAPRAVSVPGVVKEGEWSGHPWRLIAYRSGADGLCVSLTPKGSETRGEGAAMGCAPVAGVPRTEETKPTPDMTITYLAGAGGRELPPYIVGPVVDAAAEVEIRFDTGAVLRVPTFSGPAWLGDVRFYATELPAVLIASRGRLPPIRRAFVRRLTGFDSDGTVVACLAPLSAVNGISPLSDCR